MILATWNIQCSKGVDGCMDPNGIVSILTADGLPDTICLQEVARHLPVLDGSAGADQVADLPARLPDHAKMLHRERTVLQRKCPGGAGASQPAAAGFQMRRELRQSIPSSR